MSFSLGLSSSQAQKLLAKFGPNSFAKKRSYSAFTILFSQLNSPLIIILLLAAVVTFLLRDYVDCFVILLAVLINTVLGFFQEYRAQHALEELTRVLSPKAAVWRDGRLTEVSAEEIVPGDVLSIEAGTQIAADGVWLEARDIQVSQAALTGESIPVVKHTHPSLTQNIEMPSVQVDEAKYFGYMGTNCVSGKGKLVVLATASATQIGHIATQLSNTVDTQTPLQTQLRVFSNRLAGIVLIAAAIVFLAGVIQSRDVVEMFTVSVAVAVSAIPEGLAVSLTVILALGMQKMLKRKALVRKLLAAETLGSVSVICVDKTGTLTTDQLEVVKELSTVKLALMEKLSFIMKESKDTLEKAIAKSSKKVSSVRLVDEVPFSSARKYSVRLTEKEMVVVGAPDIISQLCTDEPKNLPAKLDQLAEQGYRLVAVATRARKKQENNIILSKLDGLSWQGLIVLRDHIRADIAQVFQQAHQAGIHVKVITGDYAPTARAVMSQLGLKVESSEVLLGEELDNLSPHELEKRIHEVKLFARTTPQQKLMIVEILQRIDEVVAMTGDGVNDAPALKKADIGIVVNNATDVSKETADVVLLDSRFPTIVAAVEEGRGMFENIRKVVVYLLSDSFAEVFAIIGAILVGLPLPLTAAQILWINLVNDSLPNLALTVDPNDADLMKEPPRHRDTPIVNNAILVLIVLLSLIIAVRVLIGFWFVLDKTGNLNEARTFAMAMMAVDSLLYVFSSRSLRHSILKEGLFKNRWLIWAVLLGFLTQLAAMHVPFLQEIFETMPLDMYEWFWVIFTSILVIGCIEMMKWWYVRVIRSEQRHFEQ